jgi:putative FmdB family regulatory protein
MPTYQYVCDNCLYEFERFQSIKSRPVRKCPKCGKLSVQRLIGAGAGIIFKGSGFYETDYRSDSYKKAKESETKPGTDKSIGEKKTETKAKEFKSAETATSGTKEKKKTA